MSHQIRSLAVLFLACVNCLIAQSPATQIGFRFVDDEVPSGAIDGVNAVFGLSNIPTPVSSTAVYRNGVHMLRNLDYSLSGSQLTFVGAAIPQAGDVLTCSYRMSSASATFVKTDTTTQGNWQTVYGADGYVIAQSSSTFPGYAQVNLENTPSWTWTWASSVNSDVRALQNPAGPGRLAVAWGAFPTFSFDLNITDGLPHELAIYLVDWENVSRVETIDILDASTNAVIATQALSGFGQGKYLVWTLTGHIVIRVTVSSATNCVISGLFFGP